MVSSLLCLAIVAPVSLNAQSAKPRVHILATGGTISNVGEGDAKRRTGTELVDAIPELKQIVDITVEQFSNVASSSITHEMWRKMAGRIAELSRGPNPPAGFVITHGTDTMEETAFFLDLTTSSCAPVVVTGAMRQASAVGADGPANLLNAVRVAASPASKGRGAVVLMNDEIFAARDVAKTNTTRLNAFTGIDAGPIGVTDPDGLVYYAPPPAGGGA
jgi:L-asparaginase